MNTKVIILEPFGDQEFDLGELINPIEDEPKSACLVIQGEGEFPLPESSELELYIYQCRGKEFRSVEEMWEYQQTEILDEDCMSMDEWVSRTVEWYEQRGFTAIPVKAPDLISPL
jgi:hypothetical protein